jgi:hypothetical protein
LHSVADELILYSKASRRVCDGFADAVAVLCLTALAFTAVGLLTSTVATSAECAPVDREEVVSAAGQRQGVGAM